MMARFSTMIVVVLSAFLVSVICKSEDKTKSVQITGKDIEDIGKAYNKPLLRLIGKSLMDLECRNNQACSHWTEWSNCKLFIGQFGVKERTRKCGENNRCGLNDGPRNETDTKVCFEFCPTDYTKTNEGLCLKYYNTTKLSKPDAETICNNAGGHLININSERKWVAFVSFMSKQPKEDVHIDGERKDNKSPWTFSYETDISGYTNWADNDPDNGSSDLCLIGEYFSIAGIYDNDCSTKRPYVCEIMQV